MDHRISVSEFHASTHEKLSALVLMTRLTKSITKLYFQDAKFKCRQRRQFAKTLRGVTVGIDDWHEPIPIPHRLLTVGFVILVV